jgi:hypothetical protein
MKKYTSLLIIVILASCSKQDKIDSNPPFTDFALKTQFDMTGEHDPGYVKLSAFKVTTNLNTDDSFRYADLMKSDSLIPNSSYMYVAILRGSLEVHITGTLKRSGSFVSEGQTSDMSKWSNAMEYELFMKGNLLTGQVPEGWIRFKNGGFESYNEISSDLKFNMNSTDLEKPELQIVSTSTFGNFKNVEIEVNVNDLYGTSFKK